jgi:putative transposase
VCLRGEVPEGVECLRRDEKPLIAFFDFPADHWVHGRTTKPIESAFPTVRTRQRVTKGPGSRVRGLAMAFRFFEMAQPLWCRITTGHRVALLGAGRCFQDGVLAESADTAEEEKSAA